MSQGEVTLTFDIVNFWLAPIPGTTPICDRSIDGKCVLEALGGVLHIYSQLDENTMGYNKYSLNDPAAQSVVATFGFKQGSGVLDVVIPAEDQQGNLYVPWVKSNDPDYHSYAVRYVSDGHGNVTLALASVDDLNNIQYVIKYIGLVEAYEGGPLKDIYVPKMMQWRGLKKTFSVFGRIGGAIGIALIPKIYRVAVNAVKLYMILAAPALIEQGLDTVRAYFEARRAEALNNMMQNLESRCAQIGDPEERAECVNAIHDLVKDMVPRNESNPNSTANTFSNVIATVTRWMPLIASVFGILPVIMIYNIIKDLFSSRR